MSEGIEDINALTLYEQLDKWDKIHLPKLKNFELTRKVTSKISQRYDSEQFKTIRFHHALSQNLTSLKASTKNENLQKFYKNIEQEKSNVLAQNLNMVKQGFDFNVFNPKKKRKSTKKKISVRQLKRRSITTSNNNRKEQDELWKVGKEIQIRKRIIFDSKRTELKDNIEDFEEIKIEDRTLKLNDLKLEGNYTKVTSFDVYKNIVEKKKKIESNFREQISKLNKDIKTKESKLEELNKELTALANETERKKTIYFDNYDVIKVIESEIEKSQLNYDFQRKTLMKRKIQDLEHIVEKSRKEYYSQKLISDKEIPKLKKKIHICKVELKSLQEILSDVKKENIIYFKNLLKEGVDVRDVGLCWILFRLSELGANVENSDFPKFLDYVSIKYLLEYSDKIIKMNKLKILLDLVKKEKKNVFKSLDINNTTSRKSNFDDDNLEGNNIVIPYDNIDEFLKEIFNKFKFKMGNKFVILENYFKQKDEEVLKNAQDDIRRTLPSFRSIMKKKNIRTRLLTDTFSSREISNSHLNSQEIKLVDTILVIKNVMNKIDKEMRNDRTNHLNYFKKKYESMKLKGTSECIKYDLMFCALFGNFAVY